MDGTYCLRLRGSNVVVARADQGVLVENVMFRRGTNHPHGTSRLREDSSARVRRDVKLVGVLDIMIGFRERTDG